MNQLEPRIQEIQENLLEILNQIHIICERHNLHYFMIGGTLIGAVRHRGFIPWDDDIDIGLPRSDYEKLISIRSELPEWLTISAPRSDSGYIYLYAKCYNRNTTVTENFATPFTRGLWVDIFPIDDTYSNKYAQKIHTLSIKIIKTIITSKLNAYSLQKNPIEILLRRASKALFSPISINALTDIANKIIQHKNSPTSQKSGNLLGRWGEREIHSKETFKDRILINFESYQFYGLKLYDQYLRKIYRNYMEPPPLELQKTNHDNLNIELGRPYQLIKKTKDTQ